jgi:hypothetical protein
MKNIYSKKYFKTILQKDKKSTNQFVIFKMLTPWIWSGAFSNIISVEFSYGQKHLMLNRSSIRVHKKWKNNKTSEGSLWKGRERSFLQKSAVELFRERNQNVWMKNKMKKKKEINKMKKKRNKIKWKRKENISARWRTDFGQNKIE